MSQQDLLTFLKKHKRKFTAKELANKLGVSESATSVSLRKLRKDRLVNYEKDQALHWNHLGRFIYWNKPIKRFK